MSDRKALLRGVIDNPDDDTPRLVMADWFEENGEPDRAEFIRLQVELAREDVAQAEEPLPWLTRMRVRRITGDPDRKRRIERMGELYDAHRKEWESEVAAWARRGADFCRGFIGYLDATVAQWLKGASGLHRAAPVTELSLHNTAGLLGELAACPHLSRVSSLLLLLHYLSRDEGRTLADSPHFGRLRSLRLINGRASSRGRTCSVASTFTSSVRGAMRSRWSPTSTPNTEAPRQQTAGIA
jgi:uncharacterized protein (TIGR02996 family)